MINTLAVEQHSPDAHPTYDRAIRILLWVFTGAIFFSLGGVLAIKIAPDVMRFFGPYFATLVKAPTWTYMALLPVIVALMYLPGVGGRRLTWLILTGSIVGAAAELLGTTTGFPFGGYGYTDWLGPKMLSHVPYFIPLSWFAMALVCYDLSLRVTRRYGPAILLGSLFMVGWDVSLDPAMSRAFPFWTYTENGFFYGMPLSNWGGWFLTSLVILALYSFIARGVKVQHRLAPAFFFLNCFFPFMLSLQYGLYGATVAGVLTTAVILSLVRWTSTRPGPSSTIEKG
ncbi:MAG: bisanhydrobacterioruberin hydratase CruF [Rhodothermales bacterium]|nr:bisanhydrobacterioruberin hydratase CruF [Rhodothermales bacterium]